MGRHFSQDTDFEVPASVEEVWDAIATGPGVQSWYLGRTEVEPGEGGVVRTALGEYAPEAEITGWEPNRRLAHRDGPLPDGRFLAFEFLVEGRERSSTVVRVVTSGFLPGDDWADEYEAMLQGGALYLATLTTYLTHFVPRTASPFTVWGPAVSTWDETRDRLHALLGVADPAEGDRVRFAEPGIGSVDGVVFHANDQTVGVRTDNAMYRFMRGFRQSIMVSHLLFDPAADVADAERAWDGWLTRNFV
ncbi:SRPBCC family protein [Actinokineospora sp. 24-640]